MRACVHWQEAFIPRESNHTVASAVCLTRRRCVLFVPGGVGVGTGAQGFVYWVDAADKQPCLGTAGMVPWQLKAKGKLFHSGLPHQAVNPMEMCMEAVKYMQDRFYQVKYMQYMSNTCETAFTRCYTHQPLLLQARAPPRTWEQSGKGPKSTG